MEMYDLTLQPTNDAIEIQGMMVPLKSGTEATMTACAAYVKEIICSFPHLRSVGHQVAVYRFLSSFLPCLPPLFASLS